MDSIFVNKTFLITGGGSGIGRAAAQMLASRGANISIADIDDSGLEAAAAAIKTESPTIKILTTSLDVRDERAVANWVAESESKFGPIHGCVNSAGIAPLSHFEKTIENTPLLDWERTIAINLTGVMLCLREQIRTMKKSNIHGSIVNITSAAGLTGIENGSPYSASKWGVIGLTRSVAKETASAGIRITAVAPGWTDTPMLYDVPQSSQIQEWARTSPLGRAAKAEEVAELILFLLSERSSFVTGSVHVVDGGISA